MEEKILKKLDLQMISFDYSCGLRPLILLENQMKDTQEMDDITSGSEPYFLCWENLLWKPIPSEAS